MDGIKYITLVEISSVDFELQEVEIGDFSVCINNTHVLHAAFLATQHTTMCLDFFSDFFGCYVFTFTKPQLKIIQALFMSLPNANVNKYCTLSAHGPNKG